MSWAAQTVHVLRKDLRRLWPWLAGLVAVLALGVLNLLPHRLDAPFRLEVVPLVLALLAVLVIRQDNPAGDRSLWPTLPLRPSATLLAKVAFITLLLGLVPVTVEALWFRKLQPDLPLLPVAGASLLQLLAVLSLAALGASVTRSLRALVVLTFAVWMGMTALELLLRAGDVSVDLTLLPRRPATQAVLIGASLLLLAHQYVTRRTIRSALLGLSVLLLLPWLPTRERPRDRAPAAPSAGEETTEIVDRPIDIRIRLDELTRNGFMPPYRPRPEAHVVAHVRAEVEPGISVLPTDVHTRLTGPGIDASFSFPSSPSFDLQMSGHQPVIPGLEPAGGAYRGPIFLSPVFLPVADGTEEEIERLSAARRLEITAKLEVYEWVEMGRFPAEPDAALELDDGTSFRVHSLTRSEGEVGMLVGHRWRVASPFLPRDASPGLHEDVTFVVHSKVHGEFMIDTGNELMPELRSLIGAARLEERRAMLAFDPRMAGYGRSGRPPLPEDWFDDIEIIVLERRLLGHVTRGFAWELDAWPGIVPVRIDREGTPLQR